MAEERREYREKLRYDETMHKVFEALRENDIDDAKILDIITSMQNRGILFRENSRD